MKLIDIIKELNLRSGADIDDDVWVVYINSALRTFGRYIGYMQRGALRREAEKDGLYKLPDVIKDESIKGVWISGEQILPARYDEDQREGTYCIVEPGKLRINVSDWNYGYIVHNSVAEAETRDESNSEDEYNGQDLGVDDEYINAVIYGALAEYNEVSEEIEAANNYLNKADEIVARAMQGRYSKSGKYPVTKDVMRWN